MNSPTVVRSVEGTIPLAREASNSAAAFSALRRLPTGLSLPTPYGYRGGSRRLLSRGLLFPAGVLVCGDAPLAADGPAVPGR